MRLYMNNESFSQTKTSSKFPPIFLVGMMGSGKSYWCKAIARQLNFGGVDLDAQIEKVYQQSIVAIFNEKGETFFREKEAAELRTFSNKNSVVVATGGGTPCFHDNMLWMNQHGITIWIDEPVHTLAERLLKEKSHRPLVANFENTAALTHFLSEKLAERSRFYGKADIHLKGEQLQIETMITAIQSFENKQFNINQS